MLSSPDSEDRVIRDAVRVLVVDQRGAVLLLSTRDASNPDFTESWEIPGGGIVKGETLAEAGVREVFEETGLRLFTETMSEPLWRRSVFYTYRGEKRLQREAICSAQILEVAPSISCTGREPFEQEDHLTYRWWSVDDLLASQDTFYPRTLPHHISALLDGCHVDDPVEVWT